MKLYLFDVWVMGLATVLSGQFFGWNAGVAAGFGAFTMMQFVMMVAFIILACSLGEMIGMTLFSGGSYGIGRVTLGFYGGFMLGAFELLEHVVFTANALQFMTHHICVQLHLSNDFFPLIAIAYYLLHYFVILSGHNNYWWILRVLVVITVTLIVIFVFGAAQYANLPDNASNHSVPDESGAFSNWFVGSPDVAMTAFPIATIALSGMQSTILITDMLSQPRKQISRGMILIVVTLCLTMTGMYFVGCSLSPGIIQFTTMDYLTDSGYSLVFGITAESTRWFLFPVQLALSVGLLLPSGKLFYALSDSHLLPPWLQVHLQTEEELREAAAAKTTGDPKPPVVSISKHNAVSPEGGGNKDEDEPITSHNKFLVDEEMGKTNTTNTNHNDSSPNKKEASISAPATVTDTSKTNVATNEGVNASNNNMMVITKEHRAGMTYILMLSFVMTMLAEYCSVELTSFVVAIACLINILDLYSYIEFRRKFASAFQSNVQVQQEVTPSPFGILGAVIAAAIFFICEISALFFQNDWRIVFQMLGFYLLCSSYYFFYAKSRQRFSRTEEKTLLAMHVITNNRNNKSKKKVVSSEQYKQRLIAQRQVNSKNIKDSPNKVSIASTSAASSDRISHNSKKSQSGTIVNNNLMVLPPVIEHSLKDSLKDSTKV